MGEIEREVRQVRIDVPLSTSYAYLFVDAEQTRWDPWWGKLYEYLLKLAPAPLHWEHEPVQNVYVSQLPLGDIDGVSLVSFLRSAPEHEVEKHRTLRRAIGLSSEQQKKLRLMYFEKKGGT